MAEEGKVGEARVEIIADIVVSEESLSAAAQQVQSAMGKEASPVTERPARGREKQVVDVEANVSTKLTKNVHKDIQDAIYSDEFQLAIDTGDIRAQIQRALRDPFTITLNAEVQGAAAASGVGVAHGPAVQTGAPMGRGPVPPELESEMFRHVPGKGKQAMAFRDAIDAVYRNVNEALTGAGKGRFGSLPLDAGRQVEKLGELMDQFGDKVADWVQVAGPTNRPTGRGSIMEFLKSEGVDVAPGKTPAVTSLAANIGGFGGDTRRSAELFAVHVRNWLNAHPVQAAPAAAAQPTAQAAMAQAPVAKAVSAIVQEAEQAMQQAREATQAERQQQLSFTQLTPDVAQPFATSGPFGRRRGRVEPRAEREGSFIGPRLGELTETASERAERRRESAAADRRARTGLGIGERANVRRLRGRAPQFQGIDLEPFLRAAESGAFQDVFERFEGRESKGLFKADSETTGGFDELSRLGKRRPGVKFSISGQEGKFAGVRPSEAFMRTFAEATGAPDAAREFLEGDEDIQNMVRAAVAQGARPARAAMGSEGTKRGQGGIRQLGSRPAGPGGALDDVARQEVNFRSSAAEFQEASKRYEELQRDRQILLAQRRDLRRRIDQANEAQESERAEATTAAERKAADRRSYRRMGKLGAASEELEGQLTENAGEMSTLRAREPILRIRKREEREQAIAAAAERSEMGGRSRRNVEQGIGFSEAELRERELQEPGAQGRWGAQILETLGLEGGPETIKNALTQRFLADEDRPEGRGGTIAMRRAAFGATGRARRTFKPGEDAGIFGEVMSQVPSDLGRGATARIRQDLIDILNGVIGDEAFRRGLVEEAAQRKEQMASVRPGTTSSTIAHGLTGEGEFRFPPGQGAAIDVDIRRQEEKVARLEAQIARGTPRKPTGIETDAARAARLGTVPRLRSELELARSGGFDDEGKPVPGLSQMLALRQASQARQALEAGDPENTLFGQRKAIGTRQETMAADKYITGDETTEMARAGGVTMEPQPVDDRLPLAAFSEKYAGGGPGVPPGGPPAPPSGPGGGWESITGPIHVIVDNVPLAVTFAGTHAGSGQGRGRVRGATEEAQAREIFEPTEPEAPELPNIQPRSTQSAVERAMERDFVAALRGQNDPRAREAFEKRQFDRESRYLSGTGPTAAESGFLAALQESSRQSGVAGQQAQARVQQRELMRARREARVNDPGEFARQQDIADTALGELRGRNRALQRRVPRRGFGASVTDLVTSGFSGGALEAQLESADRAQRELTEINQAAQRRGQFRTQARGLLPQIRAAEDPAVRTGLIQQFRELREAARQQTKIIGRSTEVFNKNATVVERNTAKAFAAAAAGATVSGVASLATFAVGGAFAAGVSLAVVNGLEKILGDPSVRAAVRTGLGESTRAAGGRSDIAVAQQVAATGLAGPTAARLSPILERTAAIEAGNKALSDQIGLLKVAEESQRRGADAGVTQTLNGILGTFVNGTMPAAEQIGNFLGNSGVRRLGGTLGTPTLGGPTVPLAGGGWFEQLIGLSKPEPEGVTDGLVGDVEKFRDRLVSVNEFLAKAEGNLIRFSEGLDFAREDLAKQADALEFAGAPRELVSLIRRGTAGITRGDGQLATADEALAGIGEALVQASKPTVDALLRQTKDERLAQIQLQDRQRDLTIQTVQPQSTAIGLAQQGFGAGGRSARDGINLGGIPVSDQRRLNTELDQTQRLYDQINNEVDVGVKAAKEFVSATFSYDPKIGQDFAKSLDLSMQYAKQISSIQIGIETKQAAYQAAQFAYQINIAKRSLADARGLAGQLTDAGKDNLGVLEREQFFLQRRAQFLQLELSQRQINFQRSIAGFTAPGLTGEERAARIQQAKIEADFAQKQLNIQKELAGIQGRQFTIQASRAVTDLVGQLGLLEKGRVLSIETATAEKRIRALTILQEKENKKVQTFYEAAVTRTNDIMTLQAQMVAATGEALVRVTNQVLNAFRQTYSGITATLNGTNAMGGLSGGKSPDERNALGMVQSTTSIGKYGVAGEAGGEAVAIIRDPQQLVTPLGGQGNNTTIQIIVQGNKFTSEEEEDRVMRKLTQAVKDAQGRDLALRGLRTL